jgi:cytochrome c556
MVALLCAAAAPAQSPVTMKQLMLDLIHPASNEILLYTFRGGPQDDTEWAAVRRSALTLSEAGNSLANRAPSREQADWLKDAKLLADAGAAAYQAAQTKDRAALSALTERLDASCTACHKQFRPNVFPRQGGSQ